MNPFHLAIPVTDLDRTRRFYVDTLGAVEARSASRWVDFDFFGHQLSAHLVDEVTEQATNSVDGDAVPARHFGVVLGWDDWHALVARLADSGIDFLIEPCVRFEGRVGEQSTCFFSDPSGNVLEFKSFRDPAQIFAS